MLRICMVTMVTDRNTIECIRLEVGRNVKILVHLSIWDGKIVKIVSLNKLKPNHRNKKIANISIPR